MNLSIAIDFSTSSAALAIGEIESANIIKVSHKPMTGRDASSMLPWIIDEIESTGYKLSDIKQWSCGIGPGSFTGLRIVASIVAGLTFEKDDVMVRGIPSGIAIAEKVQKGDQNVAVLYDGRRNEIIYFAPTFDKSSKKSYTMDILPASSSRTAHCNTATPHSQLLCAMETEREAMQKMLPIEVFNKMIFLRDFPIEQLLLNKNTPWSKNSNKKQLFEQDIVYIRPAV